MGLSYTPIVFTSGTTISSSNINSNFAAIQPSSVSFSGTWVAGNNTSVGLTAEDYALTSPLSQNVIHLHPPLTSPDRGIVFSALKGNAASDRLGISTSGKLLTGLLDDASVSGVQIGYMYYAFMSGVGNGTFNIPNNTFFNYDGMMLNCGTTSGSGGSAASIGYGNVSDTTIDIYCSSSVPWICLVGSF